MRGAVSDRSLSEYFRLEGARSFLRPYGVIPDDPAQWQVRLVPMLRAVWYGEGSGGRTRYEVADQLRLAADVFAAVQGEEVPPALANIPVAAPLERTPDVWREIAAFAEGWQPRPELGFYEAEVTVKELAPRFVRLQQVLSIYFGQDGEATEGDMEGATAEDGVRMWIGHMHPRCPWELPAVAAECYEALALFSTEDDLDRFFGHELGGGSGDAAFEVFFAMCARVCIEHMRECHPSVWEWR